MTVARPAPIFGRALLLAAGDDLAPAPALAIGALGATPPALRLEGTALRVPAGEGAALPGTAQQALHNGLSSRVAYFASSGPRQLPQVKHSLCQL